MTADRLMKPHNVFSDIAHWRFWPSALYHRLLRWLSERQRAQRRELLRQEALRRQAWLALHERLRHRLQERLGKIRSKSNSEE